MKLIIFAIVLLGVANCAGVRDNNRDSITSESDSSAKRLPVCVRAMIRRFQSEPMTNPPRKIYSYRYHNATVYYVPALCCDQFSDLYGADCTLIGHPDGGFTGKGDRKITDFAEARSNQKLIWADPRH